MSHTMTSNENLALSLIFGSLGESPFNRSMDDYLAVAARAPKLAALHADVNRALGKVAAAGCAPYEICRFKAGDQEIWWEKFPTSLSIETVRQAWNKSGMRELQLWHKRSSGRSAQAIDNLGLFSISRGEEKLG